MKFTLFVTILAGAVLAGCHDYPGHRAGEPLPFSATAPYGEPTIAEKNGSCNIESVNDEPVGGQPISVDRDQPLRMVGWASLVAPSGDQPPSVIIVAQPDHAPAERHYAVVKTIQRPDVAEYLHNPDARWSGFHASFNVSDFAPGSYVVDVMQHGAHGYAQCNVSAKIRLQ